MLKEKLELIKKDFNNRTNGKQSKKTIENLCVVGIILVIAVIFINYMWGSGNKNKSISKDSTNNSSMNNIINNTNSEMYLEKELENRLKSILSKLNGVEEVEVMVTYTQTSKTIPLYNEDIKATTTEEKDTSGGIRKITENNSNREVVYDDINGNKSVITQSVINPQIEGAIIIAKGVSNASIKNNIIQAVEAVTNLPTHKIQVFEMK